MFQMKASKVFLWIIPGFSWMGLKYSFYVSYLSATYKKEIDKMATNVCELKTVSTFFGHILALTSSVQSFRNITTITSTFSTVIQGVVF